MIPLFKSSFWLDKGVGGVDWWVIARGETKRWFMFIVLILGELILFIELLLFFILKFWSMLNISFTLFRKLLIWIFIKESEILLAENLPPLGANFSKETSSPYSGKDKIKFFISK